MNWYIAIILNKAAIDKGLFVSTTFKTITIEEKKKVGNNVEEICLPPKEFRNNSYNYNKLTKNGLPRKGVLLQAGDVIVGKIITKMNKEEKITYDNSVTISCAEEGVVDKIFITKNSDNYKLIKVRIRSLRIPELGDKFCSRCYDDKTQVLTDKGWLYFKDLDKTEKMATMIDGVLNYVKPDNYWVYDTPKEGREMIYMENKHSSFCVTPNHKMYVKTRYGNNYEEMYAEDMFDKMVRFKKNVDYNDKPDIQYYKVKDVNYNMDDWLQLIGMYISDGSICGNRVDICCTKPRKIEYNINYLNNMNIDFKYSGDKIYFRCINIMNELKQCGNYSYNKRLPDWVWDLSQRQCRILLDALIEGDGSRSDTDRYYTVSLQLKDDVQKLALHCGWSADIYLKNYANTNEHYYKNKLIKHNYDYWQICIIKQHNEPWINKKNNPSNIKYKFNYTGKVYCVEVNPSHLLYVRRVSDNGRRYAPFWCMNSA